MAVIYSDIQGGWTGEGNIDEDPLFVDPDGPDNDPDTWEDNDHHLSSGSPCIDAGASVFVLPFTDTDLDGNPRRIDDPDTPDTGMPPWPIVDMGAYEYFSDCNNNGIPDICDRDCSELGGTCELPGCGQSADCNTNESPDECDIAEGTSVDADGDVVPDECDNCDLYNPDQADCQPNGVGDVCDVAYETSDDDNDNDVPDECERRRPMPEDCASIPPGNRCSESGTCTTDADCWEESHCVITPGTEPPEGVCYAPKMRFLSIAANPEQAAKTARRVKLDDGTELGWVGEPYYMEPPQEPLGLWLADIVDWPTYDQHDGEDGFDFVWPDVVHVTGCAIGHASLCSVSGSHCNTDTDCLAEESCVQHSYHIQALPYGFDPADESNYSEALALRTNSTWGDTVGDCGGNVCKPPDALAGLNDILAAIAYFQGNKDIAPITWMDIDPSNGSQIPEQIIGVGDIMAAIAGFQGAPYPGDGPSECP